MLLLVNLVSCKQMVTQQCDVCVYFYLLAVGSEAYPIVFIVTRKTNINCSMMNRVILKHEKKGVDSCRVYRKLKKRALLFDVG